MNNSWRNSDDSWGSRGRGRRGSFDYAGRGRFGHQAPDRSQHDEYNRGGLDRNQWNYSERGHSGRGNYDNNSQPHAQPRNTGASFAPGNRDWQRGQHATDRGHEQRFDRGARRGYGRARGGDSRGSQHFQNRRDLHLPHHQDSTVRDWGQQDAGAQNWSDSCHGSGPDPRSAKQQVNTESNQVSDSPPSGVLPLDDWDESACSNTTTPTYATAPEPRRASAFPRRWDSQRPSKETDQAVALSTPGVVPLDDWEEPVYSNVRNPPAASFNRGRGHASRWNAPRNSQRSSNCTFGAQEQQDEHTGEENNRPDWMGKDWDEMNRIQAARDKAKLAEMVPIIKATYQEDPAVARLSESEVAALRSEMNNITVSFPLPPSDEMDEPIKLPNPVWNFEHCFAPHPQVLNVIRAQGFTKPSPIQCQLWPCLMKGLDAVGIAQTGSGKTLAFILPAMLHIEKQRRVRTSRNPTVLVMGPTRELVQQIDEEVNKYKYAGITSACIYGGGSREEQIQMLNRNPDIIIATPGRLNDLVQAGHVTLNDVSYLVLDEADEMLDQGFEPQINRALLHVRKDRQTCLTSATWPESVRRMAKNYTENPALVVVGTLDLAAVKSVEQNFVFLEEEEKFEWVLNFVKSRPEMKAIIFVGKKAAADHMSSEFCLMGVDCQMIHGGLEQNDREQAISDMQTNLARVLIATDVVSRGIDISDVTDIINYDFPMEIERYVHRVGRTGRAGRTGVAWSLLTWRNRRHAAQLIEVLERSEQPVPQQLQRMARKHQEQMENRDRDGRGGRGGRGGRRFFN